MSLPALALLLTLAPTAIEVRLEEARGVSPADAEALVVRLRERVGRVPGSGALRVRALATPGALRVTMVWTAAAQPSFARATLVGRPEAWGPALDEALAALGLRASPSAEPARRSVERVDVVEAGRPARPSDSPPPPPSAPTEQADVVPELTPPPASPPPVLGLSLLGAGVVAGVAAVVLGVMNQSARDEGNPLPSGPARDALDERTLATGLGANVLWGVAAAALISGGWLVLSAE